MTLSVSTWRSLSLRCRSNHDRSAQTGHHRSLIHGRPDESGASGLDPVSLDFAVHFPGTDEGREAAGLVERLVRLSRDKNCTVSRTVEAATPVDFKVDGDPLD